MNGTDSHDSHNNIRGIRFTPFPKCGLGFCDNIFKFVIKILIFV